MILEAEDAQLSDPQSTQNAISNALLIMGLGQVHVERSKDDRVMVFLLKEGYVIARTWPEHNYCAFDILLWNHIDKQDAVKNELVKAIRSRTPSSFRLVTEGMFGLVDKSGKKENLCVCKDEYLKEVSSNSIKSTASQMGEIILAE